jgi:hypothetical protein
MTTKALQTAANLTAEMTSDELLALNKIICDIIKSQRKMKLAVAGSSFGTGDIVSFYGKGRNAGIHYIKINTFNRARTSAVGYECNADGSAPDRLTMKWTVANTLLTLVKKAA